MKLLLLISLQVLLVSHQIKAQTCKGNPDVVIVLESSGNNTEENRLSWTQIKNFATELINQILRSRSGTRIGLITYSSEAFNNVGFTSNSNNLTSTLTSLPLLGGDRIHASALRMVQQLMYSARSNSDRYVILLTRGNTTDEYSSGVNSAERLANQGIRIIAVGVGSSASQAILNPIAPNGTVITVSSTANLMSVLPQVMQAYSICPPDAVMCLGLPEIVFVVDASGSILDKTGNWDLMKNFVEGLLNNLASKADARFALILFSDLVRIERRLTSDVNLIRQDIRNSRNIGGYTNQAGALRAVQDVLLDIRTPAAIYVIMVTDGAPTQNAGQESSVARDIRNRGSQIITIGVTNAINDTNLRDLAGPDGPVFKTPSFDGLQGEVSRVITAATVCPPKPVECVGDPEVVIVLDSSGSITDKGAGNWQLMKDFGMAIVHGLSSKAGIRFAFIQFSDDAVIVSELTSNVTAITTLIETSINMGGFTNQAAALRLVQTVLFSARVNTTKHIVFVTDGIPTAEIGVEIDLAKLLRSQGVAIISIGVTNDRNVTNLRSLAGPAGYVFESEKFEDLTDKILPVITAANICPEQAKTCEEPPEIVIIIDSSGSIVDKGPDNWSLMQEFAIDLVNGLSKTRSDARFAIVRFSNNAILDVDLTSDVAAIKAKIHSSENMGGYTNQYDALRLAQETFYGARNGSTKIIVFATDGSPTKEQGREARLARSLREQGVLIVALGVTDERNSTNLRELAGPIGSVFETNDFGDLSDQVNSVITAANICPEKPDICAKEPDIILVVDASGSIVDKGANNWNLMTIFVNNIIDGLRSKSGARFAVVRFSDEAIIDSPFTDDADMVKQIVSNSSNLEGFTNQYDALVKSQQLVYSARNDSAIYIMFVTDGEPTIQQGRESRIAASLRRQGVKLVMMGVTKDINETNLYDLAGETGNVFESGTFEDLGSRLANVLTAANVCPPDPEPCDGPPEMVLVLDSSDSGVDDGQQSWFDMQVYAANLLQELAKRSEIRFGLIKYGKGIAVVESNLTSDITVFEGALQRSVYLGGDSNLEAALVAARSVLDESRSRAARYIVLIAHGPSTVDGNEIEVAQKLDENGILTVLVWINAQQTQLEFRDLTNGGAFFEANSFTPAAAQTQQIVSATNVCPSSPETCYVTNIVFAVDSSGSIQDKGANNYNLQKEFIVKLARGISYRYPDAKFGLVFFSDYAIILKDLNNTNVENFVNIVRNMDFIGGETNLADALERSWEIVEATATGKSEIFIITDGEPTRRKGEELTVARRIRSFGVGITAIGVTKEINNNTLENMAGSLDSVFYSPTFQDLTNQVTPILEESCKEPAKAGNCTGEPDIVFVIDASGSITEEDESQWEVVKNLLSKTITQFATGNPNARFGAVVFSEDAQIVFPLTANINAALKGINEMPYSGSYTNIAAGIRLARNGIYNATRPNANKIMILITDGKSNIEIDKELDEATITKGSPHNIRIIAIGVTEEPDQLILQQIASDSNSVIRSPSYQVLSSEIDRIINISCTNHSCDGPPDMVLILDSSGSITDKGASNWAYLQNFAISLMEGLKRRPESRFAYVQFSDGALVREYFTSDTAIIRDQIMRSSHMNGWTNQAAALRAGRDVMYDARLNASKYIIMITDGYPTVEIGQETGVARILRDLGTRMIMIGVTNDTNEENLRDLSGYNGAWFYSKSFESLSDEVYGVIAAADICPGPPSPCGARDVIIVMQVTQVINNRGPDAFKQMQDFVVNITRTIYIRYPDVRFGLVIYSGVSTTVLDIADYKKIDDIDKAIRSVSPRGDSTNVAEALAFTRTAIERKATRSPQIIFISYDYPTSNLQNDFTAAENARGVGIKIVAIGISGDPAYRNYMLGISSTPNNTLIVQDFPSLATAGTRAAELSCAGGAQSTATVSCSGPTDIVFALDASGSITERNPQEWDNAKNLLYSAVQLIDTNSPDTKFGVVVFSTNSEVEFKLDDYSQNVLDKIQGIKYRGSRTNIAAAIEMARMQVFNESRSYARKILVVITDGKSNERINEEFLQASISQGFPYNISLILIGVTAEPDYATLQQMASDPTRVVRSANFAILTNEVQRVVNVACAPNAAQDPILDNPVPPTCAPLKLDVVFLVDSSGSIIKDDPKDLTWALVKDTIAGIVDRFPSNLGKDGVEVALAQYSDRAVVEFTLNRYTSPLKIKSVVTSMNNMRWSTNTSAGLYITRSWILQPAAGSRNGVKKVVILISDGEPDRQQSASYAEAQKLKDMGAQIIVIGLTSNLKPDDKTYIVRNLQQLASQPEYYIDIKDLNAQQSRVNEIICRK